MWDTPEKIHHCSTFSPSWIKALAKVHWSLKALEMALQPFPDREDDVVSYLFLNFFRLEDDGSLLPIF